MNPEQIRKQIAALVEQYAELTLGHREFVPGQSVVPPSGKLIGADELNNMVEASLDGWLTTGRFNQQFEEQLAQYLGVKYAQTTNSGSSANLLALTALTSHRLGDRALKPGDEVISVAAGFPTTVNPILQYGLVPVFVDVTLPTYNIDVGQIEAAIGPKTRAIMLAHTLGNPFDLCAVKAIAEKHQLWLVEDCCDALGSTYNDEKVGTFGDIATLSFYPAHHITMGEGGAVFTNNGKLHKIVESIRDWGRDCFCDPGKDNTCKKRFEQQQGSLPEGYDHKYTYSHIGYNLKITDMQAACGLAQLKRLPEFIEKRKANFRHLNKRLQGLEEHLILPQATAGSDPAWFGYPITLTDAAPNTRLELLKHLDGKKIGTRLLFSGNITRQPYFQGVNYRVHGELRNTDTIMNQTLWLGIYPGLDKEHLDYTAEKINEFFGENF